MSFSAMKWSVRREVWENRSLYLAPAIVGGLIALSSIAATFGGLNSTIGRFRSHAELAGAALMGTTLIVAIFYCLDALYGERRDRSILFWKSMPVSDSTAVLSKMFVPIVILPVITFVFTVATQLIMLLLSSAAMAMMGRSAAPLWNLPWGLMTAGMLFHIITVHSLYYAPIFGWLLLVSAWVKRLPFVWAFLPPAAVAVIERVVFNTTHVANTYGSRISGGMGSSSQKGSMTLMWPSHPLEFLTQPGLWIGWAFAAACLTGAVLLRRRRDPI
ncbi:MAG TPA: ABC transporter permease [Thermoanaerobaculia bacterium]|nr:ABC transporter permease [Thermoanaerobaculia bacterium]